MNITPRNAGILRASVAFLLAVLYDVLFYKNGLGINFPIFTTIALATFAGISLATKEFRNRSALLLALPTLAFAFSSFFYTNEFSVYASPVLGILGLLLVSMMLTIQVNGLPFYLTQLALPRHFDGLVSNWKNVYQDLFTWRDGQAKRVVWGIVIAFPLLIVFATLLADADPIFAEWLNDLNIWEGIWRVFRTVVLTLIVACFFYLLASDKNTLTEKINKVFKMNAVTVGVVLALLNALFVLFVYIQIKYLFGGATYVLTNDITLAEYARNGFFELARVVGIAAVLVIVVQRSFSYHGSHWSVNALQVLFIGQVGVVAASALRRMALYQNNYGFTALRLYVEWFIYALIFALIFSGLALLLKMTFRRFFQTILAAAFLTAALVSLVNVDFIIAHENVGRYLQDKKSLDMNYLSTLSRDAAPAYVDLVQSVNFESLNITQKLTFNDLLERYKHENASSTLFAYTWSQQKSQKFINLLPENVKISIGLAREKDKKYEEQNREINNVAVYNQKPCIMNVINDESLVVREGTKPRPAEPYNNVNCFDLLDNDKENIQAQIITRYKESKNDLYNEMKTGDQENVYSIIRLDRLTKQTNVLYTKDLEVAPKENMFNSFGPSNYIIQKTGNLIESDYDNRDWYVYPLILDGGYHLADKKLY